MLTSGWSEPGWILGAVGPGTAFAEIGFRTLPRSRRLFAGVLLDGVRLDPGERRTPETLSMTRGPWQDCLEEWVSECAMRTTPRPSRPPMVGYCSWYQADVRLKPGEWLFREGAPSLFYVVLEGRLRIVLDVHGKQTDFAEHEFKRAISWAHCELKPRAASRAPG